MHYFLYLYLSGYFYEIKLRVIDFSGINHNGYNYFWDDLWAYCKYLFKLFCFICFVVFLWYLFNNYPMLFKFVLLILLVYFLNQAGMNTWEIFWCVLSLCYITLIWYGFSWSEDKLNFDLDYIEEYFTKYRELFLRVLHYIYIAFMLFLFPLVLAVIDNWSNFFYPFEWVLIALSAGISCFLFLGLLLVYLEHRKTWQRYYFTAADKVKLRKREQLFADAIGSTKVLLFAQAIIGLILVYSISIEAYTRGDMHLAPRHL